MNRRTARVLILGLGNDVLRDDGVGLLAARRVAGRVGERADLTEACVATVDLLPLIEGYERVVVLDAYLPGTLPPGTPVRTTAEACPDGFGYRSFHTLPFDEMLALGRGLGRAMPDQVVIHGLAVEDAVTFGGELTPAVERAWRPWADAIAREELENAAKARSARPAGAA